MPEIEIEFKNMLNKKEYEAIYKYYNLDKLGTIKNSNYYYEDSRQSLKNNNAALRIRHTNNKSEITLKIKGARSNIEINEVWENKELVASLKVASLPRLIKEKLLAFNVDEDLVLIQQIKTIRKEKEIPEGLLVMDKTYFLKELVDYELEFEVADYEQGKIDFEKILEKFSIASKEAKPKIARAINYSNEVS
ncbi:MULTISPECIES: CYTH domain-containing protein [unclassified Gemella]|uniref:CYTH domain-containing protein n=1 Tax=unclassified Gemella TaxID=2624949 RepID=UPI001C040072|nr:MULTISPECIES: CYTH domain-containing protein [unclassified Gemella]MBU0278992.1 CYTH domain-containing protein [Gemella sp. zg-1178]QWQ38744.1 CYTH domain-containing protein [Gemella sp. zg-570]